MTTSLPSLKFVTLDVFTTTGYEGNPLAIIHVPPKLSPILTPSQKQRIAKEFNLSEVVFLHEPDPSIKPHTDDIPLQYGDVKIDIFTSIAEVPFAGHPTIGTANYIIRDLQRSSDEAVRTKYSHVKALLVKAGRLPIELVPSLPGTEAIEGVKLAVAHSVHIHQRRLADPDVLARYPAYARVGFSDEEVGKCPVVSSVKGMSIMAVQLTDLEELTKKPKQNLVGTVNSFTSQELFDEGWRVGPIASYFYVDLGSVGQGSERVRKLRTRMMGSREDPATGSAACALTGYLALTEGLSGGRIKRYHLTQGVEMGRRSEITIELTLKENGDAIESLVLSGAATKVMEGTLQVPQ